MRYAKMLAVQIDGGNEIEAEEADVVGTLYPGERVDAITRWNSGISHEETRLHISLDQEYETSHDIRCEHRTDTQSGTSTIQTRLLSLNSHFPLR
jgi:hypothetical protein